MSSTYILSIPGFTSLIISIKASHGTCDSSPYIPLPVMASYVSEIVMHYVYSFLYQSKANNSRYSKDAKRFDRTGCDTTLIFERLPQQSCVRWNNLCHIFTCVLGCLQNVPSSNLCNFLFKTCF